MIDLCTTQSKSVAFLKTTRVPPVPSHNLRLQDDALIEFGRKKLRRLYWFSFNDIRRWVTRAELSVSFGEIAFSKADEAELVKTPTSKHKRYRHEIKSIAYNSQLTCIDDGIDKSLVELSHIKR